MKLNTKRKTKQKLINFKIDRLAGTVITVGNGIEIAVILGFFFFLIYVDMYFSVRGRHMLPKNL